MRKYYRGYIPHVTILDKKGQVVYNETGEVSESKISSLLDEALK